ncbi:MAG: ABC transporter substrate-binding protein [Burkholderiales bacterium]|nr:ABC transporter substrate-binding protein [Burkholderiales bacterium]
MDNRLRRTMTLALRRFTASLVVLAAFALVAPLRAAQAEPVKIRWGVLGAAAPSDISAILFANTGILRHYGKSYVLEVISFRGSALMVPALAAKEIDVAALGNLAFASAILNAKLDIKVIADEVQEGVAGWFSGTWFVLEDSPVRKPCDLKGKSIAVPAKGTALDLALRAMLKKTCGFAADRDFSLVEVGFANQEPFLRDKKVDATILIPPFAQRALAKGGIRALFDNEAAIGKSQFVLTVARTEFLEKNRAAMQDFMEDFLIAWRWYLDSKNMEEAYRLTAAYTKLPVDTFRGWAFVKGKDYFRDPMAMPDLDALQKDIRLMHEFGFITQTFDVRKHADLSFIETAKARLKL